MHHLLIADDNGALRRSLKLALEAEGYEVRLAANGAEALAAQRERAADVLITDIFMPDCDGFEAIDAFRRAYPRTRIIAMSGDAQLAHQEYLAAAALIGVDATLKKPFQTDSLLQALRSLDPR